MSITVNTNLRGDRKEIAKEIKSIVESNNQDENINGFIKNVGRDTLTINITNGTLTHKALNELNNGDRWAKVEFRSTGSMIRVSTGLR